MNIVTHPRKIIFQEFNFYNWPEGRAMSQGSVNGIGTARAMGKLYGILANGGSDGDSVLLSELSLEMIKKPLRSGIDVILNKNITFGYGVMHTYNEEDQVFIFLIVCCLVI